MSDLATQKTQQDFEPLRVYINEQCGISIPEEKGYLFESRLKQLLMETGSETYSAFCAKAKGDTTGKIREQIIDAITTNETLWFRDERPWKVIQEVVLPNFIQQIKNKEKSKIRVWSAACSSGQEPYSLAMLIDRYIRTHPGCGARAEDFEIIGTDISPNVLFLAMSGRYNKIAMSRGLDDYYKQNYFTEAGSVCAIDDAIKNRVSFKKFNLQDSFLPLGKFDLIFCRNVAIYFSDEFKKELFNKLGASTNVNGYFFLGSSESLLGYTTPFELNKHENIIYYMKKG